MALPQSEFEQLKSKLQNQKAITPLDGFQSSSSGSRFAVPSLSAVAQSAKDLVIGAGKGAIEGAVGTARLLQGGGQRVLAGIDPTNTVEQVQENTGFKSLGGDEASQIDEQLKASNTDQKVGKVVGAVAEVFTPSGTRKVAEKGVELISDLTRGAIKTVADTKIKTVDTIENIGRRITQPEVSEATKVSLNPSKALQGTGQDIKVSVGGKLKNLSEITPTENMRLQASTEKSLNKFTKQAELFSKDRSVKGGSPVEIVGNRVDSALDFANKKRQLVGSKMGEIEARYVRESLPIGDKTLNTFAETLKSIDAPKYGIDTANAPVVQKLVQDFDTLEKSGATIGERLDFVRRWDTYLNDAKDSFGKFKENASVNTKIQNAIKVLKDETVDAISEKDKIYKGLRNQYRVYKQLDEIGDMLLGKDGAMGDRIKGAATVKRAIQSNSDAGARQFLAKLKELTGYDAIKEGDIALTAMENVGDYQGLSLLNIFKEGKSGLISKGLESLRDKFVGNNAKRVKNYITK